MTTISPEQVVEHAHRFLVWSYAKKASNGTWKAWPYLKRISTEVQETIADGNKQIIINMPPRHGKSELLSKWFPVWFLDWFPDKRIIFASYNDTFAAKWGLKARTECFRNDYVDVRIRRDKTRADDWLTEEGGGMITTGAGGTVTGEGGDLIIVDDPHKNWAEAQSTTIRKSVIDWFLSTIYTRREPGGTIIIIQTRWHEDDLTGYLMREHGDEFRQLVFPAVAEDDDKLGRSVGEALCPARYDADQLAKIRKTIGEHKFAGLFQQRPAAIEGAIIKREWIQHYTQIPDTATDWLLSWDMTFKKTTGGSFVVGQVWARDGGNFYLVNQYRRRVDFPIALRAFGNMCKQYPQATTKLVEDAANGPAVVSTLKSKIPGIILVPTRGQSKEERLHAVTPFFESGNVFLPDPRTVSWAAELIEELVTFPNSAKDDQADALSMALNRYKTTKRGFVKLNLEVGRQANPWDL